MCQRYAMKRQVPGRIPGVLPLVRHGQDIRVVEMRPLAVAAMTTAGGWWRLCRISIQPLRNVEVEKLFAPDHSGEGLTLHAARVRAFDAFLQVCVEFVRLADPACEYLREVTKWVRRGCPRQTQAELDAATDRNSCSVPHGRLGARL